MGYSARRAERQKRQHRHPGEVGRPPGPHFENLLRLTVRLARRWAYDRTWLAASHEPADLQEQVNTLSKSAKARPREAAGGLDEANWLSAIARGRGRTEATETITETTGLLHSIAVGANPSDPYGD
jgi:hypothetical protein